MTKRREFEEHLHTLREITGILGAMKNFALMETQKLSRFLLTQRRVVESIEMAATDFLTFYPAGTHRLDRGKPVYLLIGSERGLCGDFNETLLARLESVLQEVPEEESDLVLVGSKLIDKLKDDPRVVAALPGPNLTDEVQLVLVHLMDAIRDVQSRRNSSSPMNLTIIHYRAGAEETHIHVRQPFHPVKRATAQYPYPPTLNLEPFVLAAELFDHYLLSTLHEVFFSSLMAENLRRFQHMDQAIQRLERDIGELTLKRNGLRQEEITEEIEIIMLSADALRAP